MVNPKHKMLCEANSGGLTILYSEMLKLQQASAQLLHWYGNYEGIWDIVE